METCLNCESLTIERDDWARMFCEVSDERDELTHWKALMHEWKELLGNPQMPGPAIRDLIKERDELRKSGARAVHYAIDQTALDATRKERDELRERLQIVNDTNKLKQGTIQLLQKQRDKLKAALEEIAEKECPYGEGGCDSDEKQNIAREALGKK